MGLLNWLFRRRDIDHDLDAEIRSHFEMAVADRIDGGEDPQAARLSAMKEFGNPLQAREEARQVWRGRLVAIVADLWQDVRFGLRMLIKNPAFSLVVIGVLTLGIAGNAAIFSLFKSIALKPLPGVRDSATSAVLLGRTIDGRGIGISVPDYRDLSAQQQSFEHLTASMMIFASVVSEPVAVAFIFSVPSSTIVPAVIGSALFFETGILSPVIMDSSTDEFP